MNILVNINFKNYTNFNLYKTWRIKIFLSMFIGYIFFYFSRKSLVFISPLMLNDLKISIYEIGIINSIFYFTYGMSKFVGGIIADKSTSKNLMFIALILTGVLNLFIGFSNNIFIIGFFWALNAFFQGLGWPPITKQLTYWYKKNERGLWWGLLSISHNIGGAIIPIIIAFLSLNFSWHINFCIIGFCCIFIGVILIVYLSNIPSKSNIVVIKKNNTFFIFNILKKKKIFLLALAYFFIYFIKTGINDWIILYMINQKEHTLFSAGLIVFCLEIGGIFGIIFAGWITDRIIKNRLLFLFLSIIGLFFISFIFYNIPVGYKKIEYFIIFFLGFFLFAPQMLIGLISSEFVDKELACTANGFVGSFAYIGASLAGYPFSLIINISWNVYFMTIFFSEIILIPIIFFIFLYRNCHD